MVVDTGVTPSTPARDGSEASPLAYVALSLTLVVALLYLFLTFRGRPMQWPSMALLLALCAASVSGFTHGMGMKRALSAVGTVCALAAFYGFVAH